MDEGIAGKKWVILFNSFCQYIYLNLLWLLFSLPLFTLWPATGALFGVVRKWKNKEEVDIYQTFKALFRENFFISFLTGLIWLFLSFILLADFYFTNRIVSPFNWLGLLLFGIVGTAFLFTTVYLFPVIVHFKTGLRGVWKNSFTLALMFPRYTIINLLACIVTLSILIKYPILIFAVGSVGAYFSYLLTNKVFQKL